MFIRSLDEKDLEAESFEAISGETLPKIFPQTEDGQAMRWSKFKNKDAREIYEIVGNNYDLSINRYKEVIYEKVRIIC